MNEQIRQLAPAALWNYFADLNAIPRPSKKEQKLAAFIQNFAEKLQLENLVDDAGNVMIKKQATKGMEHKTIVVLQSHIDMVHQKNSETVFDFEKDGIKMFVDDDWVKAEGTTLGADNGIGVAAIMALLASEDIAHPALEALFTVDEETGMTGALALKGGLLHGSILLNLDTEQDDELTIGCAGGVDVTASGTYEPANIAGLSTFRLTLKGLTGGHSGVDIYKCRANANKLMNRLLLNLTEDAQVRIASIDGGSLRNAIPRESVAVIGLPAENKDLLSQKIVLYENIFSGEYAFTDTSLSLQVETAEMVEQFLPIDFQQQFLRALYACPNGIYRMSPEIDGLVQSSNNIAKVIVSDGKWNVQCLTRSSLDTEKSDLATSICSAYELAGGKVERSGNYPGWAPRPGAPIVKLMSDLYEEMFNEQAHVNAVHAGLECGILGTNYPHIQMISFGPNIYGAHSPEERVQISSVQKFWKYLLAILQRIPDKN